MSAVTIHPPIDSIAGSFHVSQAAEAGGVTGLVTGIGTLHTVVILNVNAAVRYAFIFDNPSAANGTLLYVPIPVPTNSMVRVDIRYGRKFKTGLTVASSTTPGSYTSSGAADFLMDVEWRRQPTVM